MSKKRTKFNYYDLFISFHSEQKYQIECVCQMFKHLGLRIWYEPDFMEETLNQFDESFHALRQSFLFVCFTSKKYVQNIRCRTEFSIAIEQEIDIVNLKVEDFNFELAKNTLFNKISYMEINFYEEKFKDMNQVEFKGLIHLMRGLIEETCKKFGQSYKRTVSNYYKTIENI